MTLSLVDDSVTSTSPVGFARRHGADVLISPTLLMAAL